MDVLAYIPPMAVAYWLSKVASYWSKISESLYFALVSLVHKITSSEEFDPSLTIKFSLRPYGYIGCLKKSKLTVLQTVYLASF